MCCSDTEEGVFNTQWDQRILHNAHREMKVSSNQVMFILGEAVHIAFSNCKKAKSGSRNDYPLKQQKLDIAVRKANGRPTIKAT